MKYSDLTNTADNLAKYAGDMQSLLGEISNNIEKIGNDGIWSGDAAENAKAEFKRISAEFPKFYEAVMSCKTHLNKVVENYQSADANAKNAIQF